jgi:hypothetical protein
MHTSKCRCRFGCASCVVGLILLFGAARAEAEVGLELEANLLGHQGVTSGGTGPAPGSIGGGVLLGIPLGRRIVLQGGLEVSGGAGESNGVRSESYSLVVPLRLKAYLREPRAGRIVPLLRIGAAYGRGSGTYESAHAGGLGSVGLGSVGFVSQDYVSHAVQGTGAVGVAYFVTESLGIGMDAGVTYSRWYSTMDYAGSSGWGINASWQASLVLRI